MSSLSDEKDIESFEKKLSYIKNLSTESDYISFVLFDSIINDMEVLQSKGYDEEILKELLVKNELEENISLIKEVKELLKMDKTELAIRLYKLYKEGQEDKDEKYFSTLQSNFLYIINSYLFFVDKDSPKVPNLIYARIIGKFLMENPEIDFNEVSIEQFKYLSACVLRTDSGKKDVDLDEEHEYDKKEEEDKFIFKRKEEKSESITVFFEEGKPIILFDDGLIITETIGFQPSNMTLAKDSLEEKKEEISKKVSMIEAKKLEIENKKNSNKLIGGISLLNMINIQKSEEEINRLEEENRKMEEKIEIRKNISCKLLAKRNIELDNIINRIIENLKNKDKNIDNDNDV